MLLVNLWKLWGLLVPHLERWVLALSPLSLQASHCPVSLIGAQLRGGWSLTRMERITGPRITHQTDALALMAQHLWRDSQAPLGVGSWADQRRLTPWGALQMKDPCCGPDPCGCVLSAIRTNLLLLPRSTAGLREQHLVSSHAWWVSGGADVCGTQKPETSDIKANKVANSTLANEESGWLTCDLRTPVTSGMGNTWQIREHVSSLRQTKLCSSLFCHKIKWEMLIKLSIFLKKLKIQIF